MKRSIFFKVFATYALLLLLFAALFLLISFRTIRSHYLQTLRHNLENLSQVLRPSVLSFLEEKKLTELDAFLKNQGKAIKTRLTVVDSEGVVLGDSEEDPAQMENHRFRPEILEALQGGTGYSIRFSRTVKEDMLYVAVPLQKDKAIIGALRSSLFISDVNQLLASLRRRILSTIGLVIFFALAGAYFFSRTITQPIRELAQASRQIAKGDFNVKMSHRFKDEWEDVAVSFNAITEEIKSLVASLRNKKEELDNILASMQEGLLVLDKEGKIVLSNPKARKIFRQDTLEVKFYWEIVRTASFAQLVENVKEKNEPGTTEIYLNDRTYLASASFLSSPERLLIVLSDITDRQNLAKMKKDLVLNVSHELRTPLTAIKGFAEALESEVKEENIAYVRRILRHTERLIRIVNDLLLLATLEEPNIPLDTEPVNLMALIETVFKMFEPKAKEKGLNLQVAAEPDLPPIEADPFRLEQMLINLIDNAVKYTEKGEVRVFLGRAEDRLVIEVCDTGIGIPEEHLPRIFERFYVVDKSRARKLGGTGLGLSIVKHIVLLHGGTIEVQSKPNEGTCFRVFLPFSRPKI